MAPSRDDVEQQILNEASQVYTANRTGLSESAGRTLFDLAKYEFGYKADIDRQTLRSLKANAAANEPADIEAAARAFFRSSPALSAEFPSEDTYVAFVKGDLGVRTQVWR